MCMNLYWSAHVVLSALLAIPLLGRITDPPA